MRQARFIRVAGSLIVLFGTAHLFLNIYVAILPLILEPGQLTRLMHALSGALGRIAVQEDRDPVILCIKITASALFITSGIGLISFKEWSRRLLFCLLGLRIIYGAVICVIFRYFYPHLAVIIAVGLFLYYYFTRPRVKEQFR